MLFGITSEKHRYTYVHFRSLGLNYLGLLMILSLGCITGLVMFGVYHECDPLTNGKLTKSDQVN